jgi:hypothetical protein
MPGVSTTGGTVAAALFTYAREEGKTARGKRSRTFQLDRYEFVGLIFNFTKSKWQTIGESLCFNLACVLGSCQITRFAK